MDLRDITTAASPRTVDRVSTPRNEDDVVIIFSEDFGEFAANAGGGAGDECSFATYGHEGCSKVEKAGPILAFLAVRAVMKIA